MSNPARAPRNPVSYDVATALSLPDAYFPSPWPTVDAWRMNGRGIEAQKEMLSGLDMEIAPSIKIPKELTTDEGLLRTTKIPWALADKAGMAFRVRILEGLTAANRMFWRLPLDRDPLGGDWYRLAVVQRSKQVALVSAGAHWTLGRLAKAYPRPGASVRVVTPHEAQEALFRCGLIMPEGLGPLDIVQVGLGDSVKVNPKSENGYPVLGRWEDEGTPARVLALVEDLRKDFKRAYEIGGRDGVYAKVRELEEKAPHLVAFKGKCKDDYYKMEKLGNIALRFYNVVPRQIALVMQSATQVMEHNAAKAGGIHGKLGSHTAQGHPLTHGGAEDLIARLDGMLAQDDYAWVHVGDDSFVAWRQPADSSLWVFSLDASNFDLTQHHSVMHSIHRALHEELSKIDPVAASVWYAFARERLVVVCGTLTYRWKHGGPSGMPLQSKVNDMLMDIFISRLRKQLVRAAEQASPTPLAADTMETVIRRTGQEMGLIVRLEECWSSERNTLKAALQERSFLFVGYRFYTEEGRVRVFCDLVRTLSQMRYPTLKWVEENDRFKVMEAMRLGAMMLSMGEPPAHLRQGFEEMRKYVLLLLRQAYEKVGDREDSKLLWATSQSPFADPIPPSLKGLETALMRDPSAIWGPRETSELLLDDLLADFARAANVDSWADEVAREETAIRNASLAAEIHVVPPPLLPGVRVPGAGLRNLPQYPLAHPATSRNLGRPPPTARWGPDAPPRPRRQYLVLPGDRRGNRVGGDSWWEAMEARYASSESEESRYDWEQSYLDSGSVAEDYESYGDYDPGY